MFTPWSVEITSENPYFNTMFCTNARATVSASCVGMGTAATSFVKSSWNVRMYRFPVLVMSVSPTMSSAHISNGCLAVVVSSSMVTWGVPTFVLWCRCDGGGRLHRVKIPWMGDRQWVCRGWCWRIARHRLGILEVWRVDGGGGGSVMCVDGGGRLRRVKIPWMSDGKRN